MQNEKWQKTTNDDTNHNAKGNANAIHTHTHKCNAQQMLHGKCNCQAMTSLDRHSGTRGQGQGQEQGHETLQETWMWQKPLAIKAAMDRGLQRGGEE